MQRSHLQCGELVIFTVLNLMAVVFTSSPTTTLDKPILDGLQITTASSTSPEGFKPSSYDFINKFSPGYHYKDASELSEKSLNISNNSNYDPHSVRFTPDQLSSQFKLDILKKETPSIIKLFEGSEKSNTFDNDNSSSVETSKSESYVSSTSFPSKKPRLYYDDIPSRKRGHGFGYPEASLNEIRVSEPRTPHLEESGYKFYFPDKYSAGSINSRDSITHGVDYTQDVTLKEHSDSSHIHEIDHGHISTHSPNSGHGGHGSLNAYIHGHRGHGIPHDHTTPGSSEYKNGHEHGRGVVSGQGHDLGYSTGPVHTPYNYPPPHYSTRGLSTGNQAEVSGFIGGGQALGKALSVLIPSALLLTGVSALFPKRVLVPTQPIKEQRQKRSTGDEPPVINQEFEDTYEVVPSQLLRREHRSDDGEEKFYDYDDGTLSSPYVFQSTKVSKEASPSLAPIIENPNPTPTNKIESSVPVNRVSSPASLSQFSNLTPIQHLHIDVAPLNGNYNHRANHVPLQIIDQGPYFIQIPPGETLPYMNPMTATTHLPQAEYLYVSPSQDEYDAFHFREFETPTIVGTSPPKMVNPIPNNISKPTGSTRALNEAISANAITQSPVIKTVNSKQIKSRPRPANRKINASPSNIQTIRASNNITLKAVEDIKASESIIHLQKITKENKKDSVEGKGTSKVLREFLMTTEKSPSTEYDLTPNGPVIGLLTAAVDHNGESDHCQRKALCEIALRGNKPKATKFETFLWSLATLVPDAFTTLYDIDNVFVAVRSNNCATFKCSNPNLDIQE